MLIRGLCGFLALFTLFLLTLSLIFSFGGDTPNLFGKNVYIIKTERIDFLKPGTALFTSSISNSSELEEGDIVVFRNADGKAGLAEIAVIHDDDGVFSFDAVSERGVNITLVKNQIVGRATQYSEFFGGLISFVKSPAGVLVMAILPCAGLLVYEGSKSVLGVLNGGKVTPVKKQDEVPTYIPRQKVSTAISAYTKTEREDDYDDEDYDDDDDNFLENLEKPAEANKFDGYDGYDGFDKRGDYPLFMAPKSKSIVIDLPEPKRSTPARTPVKTAPLSQKRLNEAIAEVNAKKGKQSSPVFKVSPPEPEAVKQYTPKKSANLRSSPTAALPSLDKLLRDDEPENRYDIESILNKGAEQ